MPDYPFTLHPAGVFLAASVRLRGLRLARSAARRDVARGIVTAAAVIGSQSDETPDVAAAARAVEDAARALDAAIVRSAGGH